MMVFTYFKALGEAQGFSSFSSRKHLCPDASTWVCLGVPGLAEADEYDEIFAALKHPVRRQILLFLEERGEASFTQLQNAVGIEDTGLMSYHLKELTPLVEQSERGKYRLSEVGQAGAELFRRVERERRRSSVAVRGEMEKWLGETIVKSVLLVFLLGFTWGFPVTVDILMSVQSFRGISLFQLAGMFLVSFFGMVLGVALFSVYYRHYHSKDAKANVKYTTIFAAVITIASSFAFYQTYAFSQGGIPMAGSSGGIPWLFGVLRAVGFMAFAPAVAYVIVKARSRR
jgi:DNA-binding transcriptional ArsR family regulator